MTDRIRELEAKVKEARERVDALASDPRYDIGGSLDALVAVAEALGFEKAKQKAVEVVDRIPGGMLTPFAIRYDDAIAALRALNPEI